MERISKNSSATEPVVDNSFKLRAIYIGQRIFCGKIPIIGSQQVLVDAIEAIPIMNQVGQISVTGLLIGNISKIDGDHLQIDLDPSSVYFKAYFSVATNLKLV